MGFRELIKDFRSMKKYFVAAVLILAAGFYLGFHQPEQFQYLLDLQIKKLQEIAKGYSYSNQSTWWLFIHIFFNNAMISVFMIYTGAIFAIIPIYALISNGLLLGYLAAGSVARGGLGQFLIAVLPHGVIEIPVVLVACAYGIRFGFLAAEAVLFYPLPARRKASWIKLKAFWKIALPLLALQSLLLLLAAGIESTLTVWLVK